MTTGRDLASVLETVGERVDPDPAERAALAAAVDTVLGRANAAIEELEPAVNVRHVGSTARGTWVSGDRDIDVFVRFDSDLDRESLERLGLQVGNEVLPDGHTEYAEHPYVNGSVKGFDVDLVPCYAVPDATAIQSAVDRTPFHDSYLQRRLDDGLAAAVRRFKAFLKGIGAYGSDLRTRGYSGYVTELLVLEYGGFREVLEAATEWEPPVHLDPEAHGTRSFEDPLVVVDPTDPERNVAAVIAEDNVARLVHYAREFLASPAVSVFEPASPEPLSAQEVEGIVEARGTTPLAVVFDPPDLVEDQLYPQLRRSRTGLVRGLEGADFEVVRSAAWTRDRAVLFVELSTATRPAVERHEGPPVWVEEHGRHFLETYEGDGAVTGPFIDGDRYVVERERDVRTAQEFVAERLFDVALGAHIEPALEAGYTVHTGTEVAALAPEFGADLAAFFDPRP
ncbi:MAG: CCA tRNA nucleotidyltransferase [Halodesulfurarchaeum sp.]